MNEILAVVMKIAKRSGELLLKYYQPTGIRTSLKADQTAVTEADLAANELICSALQKEFPNDGVLSEEANTVYPQGKEYVWVIDPMDGTTNYSLGLHHWGVSIARLKNGQPELAALYFPLLNELFSAQRGSGAFLNGERLQIKSPDKNKPFSFFTCCSRTHRRYNVDLNYKTRIFGSAAYGLCTVARGSAILAFEVTPKIWDFAGSWLVTTEARGTIQALNGESPFPLIPKRDYGETSYPILAAINSQLWSEGKARITKK